MIEKIDGMPAGVTGLRAFGKLTKEDYTGVLEPALNEAVASGAVRLLFVLDSYDGLAANAMVEDMKTGFRAWFREHKAWRKMALVTDTEWIAKAMHVFAWMAPGEIEVFPLARQEEARAWVAEA
ncbi:MAG: STAS/SEC14 domain-containing protein [Actinobacteria bacterium]|nr:STAS/SEC14 domain-containing protein [Actinomycetota bacterium]